MNSLTINDFNAVLTLVLFRITLLLATGWLLHAFLRYRNPWLSIWSWRVILVGVALVAVTGSYLPGWGPVFGYGRHSLNGIPISRTKLTQQISANPGHNTNENQAGSNAVDLPTSFNTSTAIGNPQSATIRSWWKSLTIETVVWTSYLLVIGGLMLRLLAQAVSVQMILRRAEPADEQLEALVQTTARSMGLAKTPRVLVYSLVSGPLATGVLRPTVVLPVGIGEQFSERDLRFMVAHECSHFAGRDLAWSLAAQVMRILFWPHPLTWNIPSAHRFACDMRCDAVAAGRDTVGYSRMLAGLALSWQPKPALPLVMAFFGQSETIRRVEFLDSRYVCNRPSRFRQLRAALGLAVAVGLTGTIGIIHSHKGQTLAQADDVTVTRATVTVVDSQGKPVEGAEVNVPNLRTRKAPDAHHGNRKNKKTKTNQQGTAEILFPKYTYEQMETGQVTITIIHPNFVAYYHDHSVDSPINITLDSGRRVRLTAKDAGTGQRITEQLFVLMPDFADEMPWKREDGGVLLSPPLSNDIRLMLVVCLRDGQPTLFSELIDLAKYPTGDCQINDVALSRGRRIRGRLSDDVPRPITKGRVGLAVASSVSAAPACENSVIWQDVVMTNPDGTFEFPSVPLNEVFQLAAYCSGWVSVSPPTEEIRHFSPGITGEAAQYDRDSFVASQHFAADHVAPVDIKMEPLASCRVTVQDDKGNPLPGVTVAMGSHSSWTPAFTHGIAHHPKTSFTLLHNKEEAARLFDKLHSDVAMDFHQHTTDSNGQVVIQHLAGKKNTWIAVDHPNFDLPASKRNRFNRNATVDLKPGQTTEIKLTLQRKGVDIIGK